MSRQITVVGDNLPVYFILGLHLSWKVEVESGWASFAILWAGPGFARAEVKVLVCLWSCLLCLGCRSQRSRVTSRNANGNRATAPEAEVEAQAEAEASRTSVWPANREGSHAHIRLTRMHRSSENRTWRMRGPVLEHCTNSLGPSSFFKRAAAEGPHLLWTWIIFHEQLLSLYMYICLCWWPRRDSFWSLSS